MWSLSMQVAGDSTKDPLSLRVGCRWMAVTVGLCRTVSVMRMESTQGSRSRRMDLVMCSRPIVVPARVLATVSWKGWPSGREHPYVPARCATALTQRMVKGHPDIVQAGTHYMHRKGHRRGVVAQKVGVSRRQGVWEWFRKGPSY